MLIPIHTCTSDATHQVVHAAVVKATASRDSTAVSTLVCGDAIKVLESREVDGVRTNQYP
jgi:hypothetical protein